jgi:hypothetical protein
LTAIAALASFLCKPRIFLSKLALGQGVTAADYHNARLVYALLGGYHVRKDRSPTGVKA